MPLTSIFLLRHPERPRDTIRRGYRLQPRHFLERLETRLCLNGLRLLFAAARPVRFCKFHWRNPCRVAVVAGLLVISCAMLRLTFAWKLCQPLWKIHFDSPGYLFFSVQALRKSGLILLVHGKFLSAFA